MKKYPVPGLLLVLLILLALPPAGSGCNGKSGDNNASENNGANGQHAGEVALFFGCKKAVNSGEPGDFGFVAPVYRTLPAEQSERIIRTIELLIGGPLDGEEDFYPVVPASARILEFVVEKKTAIIDLSVEALTDSPGGTLSGAIFIQAMVHTAAQFPEVEQVIVLVGGEPWCDGHSIWDEPLGPADLLQD